MVAENSLWGAPRIHGELLKLGFDVSEKTIPRWMKRASRDPEPVQRWRAFLANHREAIAAMDFFTVPTISFGVLYCFFVIRHDRRHILHFNITKQPTSSWIIQQLREAFPFGAAPRFLIHDRDAKYGTEVPAAIRSLKINAVRTSFESPWQNGIAERWVGSCRRELLDHVIALNERHLKRLLSEYVSYHHEDRTHLGLGKGTGALLGGGLGWLAGIGALAIPGLGPFIAAGPIMAALAGAGVGGAVGGLTGALVGMGIPEYEAKRYEGRVKDGGILLSVHSDDSQWTKRAKEILERTGAEDVSSTGEAKGEKRDAVRDRHVA